jgi:hypothetical protein
MKLLVLEAVFVVISGPLPVHALSVRDTPAAAVVSLIKQLKTRIELDGESELQLYDKFACWCEDTLGRKASIITEEKDQIKALETLTMKLEAETSAHNAEIEQLKKDIARNIESRREANQMRERENADYAESRSESEQCIGALEAAIKVLSGAGSGKKGFLETLQEAQLLSVVAGVRGLLAMPIVSQSVSHDNLQMVKHFVDKPEDFVGTSAGIVSAAQIANNPFGDYASQSTQIQGILKGMYDTFTADLEKDNAEEAEKQKAFLALMETKNGELTTLQLTLDTQNLDSALKTKELADSKSLREDTEEQLDADEEFFSVTKGSCKEKAVQWAERTRLRTEELTGINHAIQILSSDKASAIFTKSTTTFVQLRSITSEAPSGLRGEAFSRLRSLARKYRSVSLAEIVAEVKTSGHFDTVIASIDKMIGILRAEEQDDIEHRDRCQLSLGKNSNDLEDIAHAQEKSGKEIERLQADQVNLEKKNEELESEIKTTEDNMDAMKAMRNSEYKTYVQALKDDADAFELLNQAIVALTKFYKKNDIPIEIVFKRDPTYTVNADKAPETWKDGSYGGRKSESEGVIAILSMIKEDVEREMAVSRQDDVVAEAEYEKSFAALKGTLDKQTRSNLAIKRELVDTQQDEATEREFNDGKGRDFTEEKSMEETLKNDCAWVDTHFASRRESRKNEINGLEDAKNYLAGVDSGDTLALD